MPHECRERNPKIFKREKKNTAIENEPNYFTFFVALRCAFPIGKWRENEIERVKLNRFSVLYRNANTNIFRQYLHEYDEMKFAAQKYCIHSIEFSRRMWYLCEHYWMATTTTTAIVVWVLDEWTRREVKRQVQEDSKSLWTFNHSNVTTPDGIFGLKSIS